MYENIVYRDLEKDPLLAARMGFFRGADSKAVRTRSYQNVLGWKQGQTSRREGLGEREREREEEKEDCGDI